MSHNDHMWVKKDLPVRVQNLGFILFGVGLAAGIAGLLIDSHRFMMSYVIGFMLLLSIGAGSLFMVALEYIAGADWSVPIRRINEFYAASVLFIIVLAVPVLLNLESVFHWAQPEAVNQDKILKWKAPYLDTTFFIVRILVAGGLWSLFYGLLSRNSKTQDLTKDQNLTRKNIVISAVFVPLFAITVSVVSIDWLMSVEPHWFSTIFGVYFFSGSVLASLAIVTYTTVWLKEHGYLHPKMTNDHLYSLGALLFAFINFWAYIAFSQYLLIWYANLPEENFWFIQRWEGGWMVMSLLLIIIHFLVPYSVLLSQPAKMDPKRLKFASLWILFAHVLDLYWLVMPSYHGEQKAGFLTYALEFGFPLAALGLVILIFYFKTKKNNLIPIGDPKLDKSLNFRL